MTVTLNIDSLSEDQLLVLGSSLLMLMEGMELNSPVRNEYKESFDQISKLYFEKSGKEMNGFAGRVLG